MDRIKGNADKCIELDGDGGDTGVYRLVEPRVLRSSPVSSELAFPNYISKHLVEGMRF